MGPETRAGRPVLGAYCADLGKSGMGAGAGGFGFWIDYLQCYRRGQVRGREGYKLMELNWWDREQGGEVRFGFEVFVQRVNVWVLWGEGDEKGGGFDYGTSTIIILDTAHTHDPQDTLIYPSSGIESSWRDLPPSSPSSLRLAALNDVLSSVFTALSRSWKFLLERCEEHVSILEDNIYARPADDSRDTELWTNVALWLKLSKLLVRQIDALSTLQGSLTIIAPEFVWLPTAPASLSSLAAQIDKALTQPTAGLTEVMYKSVSIRDARAALELNTSVWRLSWITFIFLPLSCVGGIFGMNVREFGSGEQFPRLMWYFITAFPLMGIVVAVYWVIKGGDPRKESRKDLEECGWRGRVRKWWGRRSVVRDKVRVAEEGGRGVSGGEGKLYVERRGGEEGVEGYSGSDGDGGQVGGGAESTRRKPSMGQAGGGAERGVEIGVE
ncbi:hypothetical protein EJ06DRAFT_580467 [Trichodelitschia bisporula]|uniref:Cora-domain-containing protein n=1 Tax=Trichodelitschia bisporula TaxID=703511 RepID=A0A6G1I1T3_9PEZI|nr:hypothetical protein EJ06DRAFT_580467 [Trichodelitschia bisporula]